MKIRRYRELMQEPLDHLTIQRINELVTDLEQKRHGLHKTVE